MGWVCLSRARGPRAQRVKKHAISRVTALAVCMWSVRNSVRWAVWVQNMTLRRRGAVNMRSLPLTHSLSRATSRTAAYTAVAPRCVCFALFHNYMQHDLFSMPLLRCGDKIRYNPLLIPQRGEKCAVFERASPQATEPAISVSQCARVPLCSSTSHQCLSLFLGQDNNVSSVFFFFF